MSDDFGLGRLSAVIASLHVDKKENLYCTELCKKLLVNHKTGQITTMCPARRTDLEGCDILCKHKKRIHGKPIQSR